MRGQTLSLLLAVLSDCPASLQHRFCSVAAPHRLCPLSVGELTVSLPPLSLLLSLSSQFEVEKKFSFTFVFYLLFISDGFTVHKEEVNLSPY